MNTDALPRTALRLIAAGMLVAEIAIHAGLAPDHLHEVPYLGMLFVAAAIGLTVVLIGLLTLPRAGLVWAAGAVICAGMLLGFVTSRTVGLPGVHETWTSDHALGLAAVPPELVFIACALSALGARRDDMADPPGLRPAAEAPRRVRS